MSDLIKRGKEIYSDNPHFRRLANVMEHPEFREFFNEYMKDWETTKTIIMFMKLYESIENNSNVELNPHEKIAILKDIIEDPNMREIACSKINTWSSTSLQDKTSHNYIECNTPSTTEQEDSL
jgi:hypothetical protein